MRRPINGHMRCLLRWKEDMEDVIGDRSSFSATTIAGVSSGFVLSSYGIARVNSLSNDVLTSNSRELHPKWCLSSHCDARPHQLAPVKISRT